MIDRARRGKPVVVHGDGTSLWVTDALRATSPPRSSALLGQPAAIGDAFQITSDEALPWNEIHASLAAAAGVEPEYRARRVGVDRRARCPTGRDRCSATRRTR